MIEERHMIIFNSLLIAKIKIIIYVQSILIISYSQVNLIEISENSSQLSSIPPSLVSSSDFLAIIPNGIIYFALDRIDSLGLLMMLYYILEFNFSLIFFQNALSIGDLRFTVIPLFSRDTKLLLSITKHDWFIGISISGLSLSFLDSYY